MNKLEKNISKTEDSPKLEKKITYERPVKPQEEANAHYKGLELIEEKDCLGGTGVKYWM